MPEGVSAAKEGVCVTVKGPKGAISRVFDTEIIAIDVKEREIILFPIGVSGRGKAMWGTYASHIKNMIEGVTKGFEKKLSIEGVGYRAELKGDDLVLSLGFSHPVIFKTPEGISLKVEKNKITVSGIDKEKVGSAASIIRSFKKPEPYKGKGIRYEGEIVRKKVGKKAAGTTA